MRGSIFDVFFLGFFAFILVITGYVLYDVTDKVATACENAQVSIGAPTYASDACTQTRTAAANFVNLIPAVIFFTGLGAVIFAAYVKVNPLFLGIGVLLLAITLAFYYNFQQAFRGVFSDPYFTPVITQFPLPAIIANNIVLFVGGIGVLVLIVMYGGMKNLTGGSGRPEG